MFSRLKAEDCNQKARNHVSFNMATQTQPNSPRLLLVYNADGGIVNMVKDGIWKVVSPSTYPCSLCAITYGLVSMRYEWRRFLGSLPLGVVFHHKDDFAESYPEQDVALPAILLASNDETPRVLVSKQELDEIEDTTQLMARVEARLVDEHLREPILKVVA